MNTKPFEKQVRSVLDIARVVMPARYEWFGQLSPSISKKLLLRIGRDMARQQLFQELSGRLYSHFYAFGAPVSRLPEPQPNDPVTNRSFQEALRRANHGRGTWGGRFTIVGLEPVGHDSGAFIVERDGLALSAPREACRAPAGGNHELAIGDTAEVRLPSEQLGISPGYYLAQSDRPFDKSADVGTILRVYFNVSPEGAIPLMSTLTNRLNAEGVAFRFKVLSEPHRYQRRDAAVLYLRKADFQPVVASLRGLRDEVSSELRAGVPAFVKELWPGVGVAEDPPHRKSFGWHCSSALAEAIIKTDEAGRLERSERVRAVIASLLQAGIHVDAPYLNSGSADDYSLPEALRVTAPGGGFPEAAASAPRAPDVDSSACTNAALDIADALVRSAVWHHDRCTWFGPGLPMEGDHDTAPSSTACALDPSLYSGLSGTAWFLAEAARASGDASLARTALGAARQALHRVAAHSLSNNQGLYCGWAGIALSVARVGQILQQPDLVDAVRAFVYSRRDPLWVDGHFDVLSGRAGSILGLLSLAFVLEAPELVRRAQLLGLELCNLAATVEDTCSWRAPGQHVRARNLNGYSHGAAGAAHALAELFHATREQRFADVANDAIAYEERSFSLIERNWPDFRQSQPDRFMMAWCHGAPGIALSRARSFQLLGDPKVLQKAHIALGSTARVVEQTLKGPSPLGNLCHGLLAQAAALYDGSSLLDDANPAHESLVRQVAALGIASERARATRDPSLMLGSAGLGMFLLRLADRRIPSLLLIEPERFSERSKRSGEFRVPGMPSRDIARVG